MSNNEQEVIEPTPGTLSLNVHEAVVMSDVPPGTPAPSLKEREEGLPKEEIEKRQKIMLEYTRLSGRYCPPHNTKSKWVTNEDLPRLLADGKDLVAMCNLPRGKYSGIAALAHPQMDDKTPLRFFVLPTGMVIINPVITTHTKTPVDKKEGCMTFPDSDIVTVARYNKASATYQTLERLNDDSDPVLSKPITEALSGGMAHVFQHECGHLNGSQIYDADYHEDKAIGLGDGLPVDPLMWGIFEEEAKMITTEEITN